MKGIDPALYQYTSGQLTRDLWIHVINIINRSINTHILVGIDPCCLCVFTGVQVLHLLVTFDLNVCSVQP